MKPRTAIHICVGLLAAAALTFFATNLQAGSGSGLAEMALAQRRTPLLWIIDVCAVCIVGAAWWYAAMLDQFQTYMEHQNTQYTEQLEDMIERTSDLETRNDSYADRVERLESELARQFRDLSDQVSTLEASSDARRKVFEVETRRIWEHAERIFYARIETNTRQIEALNLAMQFQRAEIRRMRQAFRELQHAIASQLSLSVDPSLHAGHSDSGAAICGAPSAEPADQTEDLTALPHAPHSEAAPSPIEPDVAEQSLESVARGDAGAAEAEGGSESLSQASQRETPEWLSDYSAKVDRNSGWKSHVERLFHEARTVDAMTDEDIAARGANATARAGAAENPALAPSTDLIGAGENHVPASVGDATA